MTSMLLFQSLCHAGIVQLQISPKKNSCAGCPKNLENKEKGGLSPQAPLQHCKPMRFDLIALLVYAALLGLVAVIGGGGLDDGVGQAGGVHHGLVFLDAVGGLETGAVLGGLIAGGAPGEEVTADLDVVVGEFTVLVVIHTEELSLLGGAELEAGDEVDDLGDDGGHDEGVGGGGDDGGDLPADGLVVVVHETTSGTSVDTVEADDGAGSEEGVEEETDHAADTVLSEDIERVVNLDHELDC